MEVVQLGNQVLREKSVAVAEVTEEIKQMANEMFDLMIATDGVGLAAPQVGKNLRMFVIIADDDVRRVFINPQIISTSTEIVPFDEGCLSIPKIYETVHRPKQITVQALDINGKPFTLEADGLLARIIQHENDHLDGVLFIDRVGSEFRQKVEKTFEMREIRRAEKEKQKLAKQAKIAAKIAKKNGGNA